MTNKPFINSDEFFIVISKSERFGITLHETQKQRFEKIADAIEGIDLDDVVSVKRTDFESVPEDVTEEVAHHILQSYEGKIESVEAWENSLADWLKQADCFDNFREQYSNEENDYLANGSPNDQAARWYREAV